MNTHADKTPEKSQSPANAVSQKPAAGKSAMQLEDNRAEAIAQRKLQEAANNSPKVKQARAYQEMADDFTSKSVQQKKDEHASPVNLDFNKSNAPVQRTEIEAKAYVFGKKLWRPGTNLISLMAELYLEYSPEYDQIYQRFINNLPEKPGPATEGYDMPTVLEVNMNLEEEINRQKALLVMDPMPPLVANRVKEWSKNVKELGLERRDDKTSDGERKRAKMMNAGGEGFRLYHTKTAPTKNHQQPGDQGKSAFFNQNQGEYFRSSANNVQKHILGITSENKLGDAAFVNALAGTFSTKGGKTKGSFLEQPAVSNNNTPFATLEYKPYKQGHPGPKLGTEINAFTYNQLGYQSDTRTYKPRAEPGNPKEYLDEDQYFEQTGYFTDRHFETPGDYEPELFAHYHQIVSGAQAIYGDVPGKIGDNELILVQASMGGKTDFFNYPAVIFELIDKENLKDRVEFIKNAIIAKWNSNSSVKMIERQSFGFLYPSISDLEKSIRIWPGQYQVKEFLSTLLKVITPQVDNKKQADADMVVKPETKLPLLRNTLKRSMNLATAAVSLVKDANEHVKLLFNRIASNYGKGLEILRQWDDLLIDALFVETAQIIENINEAVLHLSTEYDQGFAKDSFEAAVVQHYFKYINASGYSIDSFYLTHSGQQASSSAMIFNGADTAFIKESIRDRGPIYFETVTSQGNNQQVKLVDPAYNFTCHEEVHNFAGQNIKDAQIYDITNLDPTTLPQLLDKNPNVQVSLYASFSKHFQFGTDSTNLGFVMHLRREDQKKKAEKKYLGSYVPEGAVWDKSSTDAVKKDAHVPAVPSELYHHAALLLAAQTGNADTKKQEAQEGPQQFFMGHQFSDWHGNYDLEVAKWVAADNQCGIHSLHDLLDTPDSRQELLTTYHEQLSPKTKEILLQPNEWLDQDALIEIAAFAGESLAVYEFNQQYGMWALVAGDENNPTVHIGRVPHASEGGNDHWVPLWRI